MKLEPPKPTDGICIKCTPLDDDPDDWPRRRMVFDHYDVRAHGRMGTRIQAFEYWTCCHCGEVQLR